MAVKKIDECYCPYVGEYRKEFVCDNDTDIASLPKCACGSTAVVISSGKVYMVNTQGAWVEFGGGE